jgi:2-succinyl-5-enolpyruvyl-6-hydroxy-3-cyclohexene-1-carboxylate synthase
MKHMISDKQNIQILISLLKAYNIHRVVVSPGATHMNFVATLQNDSFFQLYSEIDERNAGYIACGLAAESGDPIVITCTGATASRNYYSALTEAFYRKLPVLAITGTQDLSMSGNLSPQFTDRGPLPKDVVRMSVTLQSVHCKDDEWDVNLKVNRALSELTRRGGGPVHINLVTEYQTDTLSAGELPDARVIRRYTQADSLPVIPNNCKIAISVGAHKRWTAELTKAVDQFCASHDAIVFADHSSGYYGKYRVFASILAAQEKYRSPLFDIDLLIHIGEQSGDYYAFGRLGRAKEVWRASEDGELRDTFKKLTAVFEMPELDFFKHYTDSETPMLRNSFDFAQAELRRCFEAIPNLPLSNILLAQLLSDKLPKGSALHLGVSNTMRSWTFFDMPNCDFVWANTGCRGIDGALPTAVGMAFAAPEKPHFCVLGDLTFFYGLNALGNRCFPINLRIILINNGRGTEFRMYQHKAQKELGPASDPFVAAAGHFGNQSDTLVRDLSVNLGFTYCSAKTKEELNDVFDKITAVDSVGHPILAEIFTDSKAEDEALKTIRNLISVNPAQTEQQSTSVAGTAKKALKIILGDKAYQGLRKRIK